MPSATKAKTLRIKDQNWTIIVASDGGPDLTKVEIFLRTGFYALEDMGRSSECSVFSMMPKGADAILVQVELHPDGGARVQACVPTLVRVIPEKKKVFVDLFALPASVLAAAKSVQ